jgi:hypothetical protein
MEWLIRLLRSLFAELLVFWDRPDGVLSSPVPVLEDIDLEDDPDTRLLDMYGMLRSD